MAAELDGASLLNLFSRLPGEAVAACTQVCRAWRTVAVSEVLWQRKCQELEPHPHLRRDDLLPAFGGSHRAYFAWRWPLLRRRVGRILVDREAEGQEIATYPAPSMPSMSSVPSTCTAGVHNGHSSGGGGGSGSTVPKASQGGAEGMEIDDGGGSGGGVTLDNVAGPAAAGMVAIRGPDQGVVAQPTWSPAGALLAYTEMTPDRSGHFRTCVVVADGRTGQRLGCWQLASTMPPFFYHWTACGTRLLFLSNWEGNMVGLRSLDIAPALLPLGRLPATQEVLLCAARPLFLDVSPTGTRLVWHGDCRMLGLADAATVTGEDGAAEDSFCHQPVNCRVQAPQWLVDSSGGDLLLVPVMHGEAGEGEEGVLVLASLAGVSEALWREGSRLSPALMRAPAISQQVAPFTSARDLFFAASPGATHVAWCDRGVLRIRWTDSEAAHQIFPLPDAAAAEQQQQHQQQQRRQAGGRGGGSEAAFWLSGSVQGMQWSADGRRLLLLVRRTGGPAPMIAMAKRPHYRWMVYDAPPDAPPPAAPQPAAAGWLGALTQCCPFNPTLEFFDRYLPFLDQYSRSMRFWSPDSNAFCLTSRGRPGMGEMTEEAHVSIQQVPRPAHTPSGSSTNTGGGGGSRPDGAGSSSSSSGGGGGGGAGQAIALLAAPLPEWLAPGHFASWSWL